EPPTPPTLPARPRGLTWPPWPCCLAASTGRVTMPIVRNDAKRKMLQGEMALGFQVYHLRSIATPPLAAASGYDCLFIDMETGAFQMQEATQICIPSLPPGVAPIVRVCTGALDEGTR